MYVDGCRVAVGGGSSLKVKAAEAYASCVACDQSAPRIRASCQVAAYSVVELATSFFLNTYTNTRYYVYLDMLASSFVGS